MLAWYLIYTKSLQEDVALDNLKRQDYVAYLPKVLEVKKLANRAVKLPMPMFPRYLFVRLDDQNDNWDPIRSTIGVQKLIRFGVEATTIPDQLIACIRSRENEKGLICLSDPNYQKGDKVFINSGSFQGYQAVFAEKRANDRVIVLLSLLEKQVHVNLDKFEIQSA